MCNWSSEAKLASFRCLGIPLGSWEGWGLSLWLLVFWRQFGSHSVQERAVLNAHLSRFSPQFTGWCPLNWSKAKGCIEIQELEKKVASLGRGDGSHAANGRVYKEVRWGCHHHPLPHQFSWEAGRRGPHGGRCEGMDLPVPCCCCYSVTKSCLTYCDPTDCSKPAFPAFPDLLEFPQTHVPCVDDASQPSHPLLPPSPLALNLCQLQIFSNDMTFHIRWPKYWSFSYSISPSNEYSGLISFGIDWFDLPAIQGTLKGLFQCHNLKASIIQHSVFFMTQLSHPYMTTGKTIVLTKRTFVGKVMSLLFNMLSRFVIAFLSKSKHPLILWLQSPSPVILESKKIKSVTVSTFSPSICHEVMGPNAMILVWWMLRISQPFHSPLSLSSRASLVSLRFAP